MAGCTSVQSDCNLRPLGFELLNFLIIIGTLSFPVILASPVAIYDTMDRLIYSSLYFLVPSFMTVVAITLCTFYTLWYLFGV